MIPEETFWQAVEAHIVRWSVQMYTNAHGLNLDEQDMAQTLRIRLWRAYQRGIFSVTGEVISYGNKVARSVAIDALRTHTDNNKPLQDACNLVKCDEIDRHIWQSQFWGLVSTYLHTPAERVAIGTIAVGTPARKVARQWPHLFESVNDVYNVRRNVLGRLRRSQAFMQSIGGNQWY